MKQITQDWNEITGLVKLVNYLKMSPNIKKSKEAVRELDNRLFNYFSIHHKPYNPAVPE